MGEREDQVGKTKEEEPVGDSRELAPRPEPARLDTDGQVEMFDAREELDMLQLFMQGLESVFAPIARAEEVKAKEETKQLTIEHGTFRMQLIIKAVLALLMMVFILVIWTYDQIEGQSIAVGLLSFVAGWGVGRKS